MFTKKELNISFEKKKNIDDSSVKVKKKKLILKWYN
jgi:hypothetical protein